jgi:hypothetical protein
MGPIQNINRLLHRGPVPGEQLRLPMDVPGEHTASLRKVTKQFAATLPTRIGSNVLFKVGVPLIAATTPAVISVFDHDGEHGWFANLAVGTGLGGAWGAMVGATIPQKTMEGVRIPRINASANGMAKGLLMAPMYSVFAKLVVDVVTRPIDETGTPGAPGAPLATP